MTLYSLSEYLPLGDLVKIIIVVMAVAVIAPAAVSLAVVGLDRRHSGARGSGTAMIVVGALVLLMLVAIGLYALTDR